MNNGYFSRSERVEFEQREWEQAQARRWAVIYWALIMGTVKS